MNFQQILMAHMGALNDPTHPLYNSPFASMMRSRMGGGPTGVMTQNMAPPPGPTGVMDRAPGTGPTGLMTPGPSANPPQNMLGGFTPAPPPQQSGISYAPSVRSGSGGGMIGSLGRALGGQ